MDEGEVKSKVGARVRVWTRAKVRVRATWIEGNSKGERSTDRIPGEPPIVASPISREIG